MQEEIALFIQYLKSERNASPHTVEAYSRDLEQFACFVSEQIDPAMAISGLTHLHIRRYLAALHKELSKSSIGRKLAAVRSLFRFLLRRGIIEKNPAELVSTPKKEKNFRTISTSTKSPPSLKLPKQAAFSKQETGRSWRRSTLRGCVSPSWQDWMSPGQILARRRSECWGREGRSGSSRWGARQ